MSTVIPLNDWVLVQEMTEDQMTAGGIVIPASSGKDQVTWGTVVALSYDAANRDTIDVGREVCWPEFTGVEHDSRDHTRYVRYTELVSTRP